MPQNIVEPYVLHMNKEDPRVLIELITAFRIKITSMRTIPLFVDTNLHEAHMLTEDPLREPLIFPGCCPWGSARSAAAGRI